jgi:hypothetical protein
MGFLPGVSNFSARIYNFCSPPFGYSRALHDFKLFSTLEIGILINFTIYSVLPAAMCRFQDFQHMQFFPSGPRNLLITLRTLTKLMYFVNILTLSIGDAD